MSAMDKIAQEIDKATTSTESAAIATDNLVGHGQAYGESGYELSYEQKTALIQASDAILNAERELRRAERLVNEARGLE